MTCGWNDQRKVEADPWVEGGWILSVGWNGVNLSAMWPVSRRRAVLGEGHFCGGWAGTCRIRPRRRWGGWLGGNSVSLISVMFVKSYWSASCASCPWWFDLMVGAEPEARAEWGLCHSRVSSLWDDPPSSYFLFSLSLCRPSWFRLLESPQIVLLRAGAFRQGDVVHSHLAAAASPTLSLQDHLVNSKEVFLFECFAIETAACDFFLYIRTQTRLLCGKKKSISNYA